MHSNSLLYSNARIKSKENLLMSELQLSRLLDSENIESAFRILQENNYGGGQSVDSAYEYDKLLAFEENIAVEFLKETMVPKKGIEAFLIMVDYHNIKSIVKAKMIAQNDLDTLINAQGLVDVQDLKVKIFESDYSDFDKDLQELLTDIDNKIEENKITPREVDIALDRLMYKKIFQLKYRKNIVYRYFKDKLDLINLNIFLRTKRKNLPLKFLEESLIEGGDIDIKELIDIYEEKPDTIKELIKDKPYAEFFQKAYDSSDIVKFETDTDNYLLKMFSTEKNNLFSVAPTVGFYLAKLIELKIVKLIMVCINNKVDKTLLKERLRDLYAW